jgi:hypothetical protein
LWFRKSSQFRSLSQVSDTFPAVATRQLRDELKNSVDRFALGRWPAMDPDDQQPIKLRQPPQFLFGLIIPSIDSLLHTTHLTAQKII